MITNHTHICSVKCKDGFWAIAYRCATGWKNLTDFEVYGTAGEAADATEPNFKFRSARETPFAIEMMKARLDSYEDDMGVAGDYIGGSDFDSLMGD